MNHATRILAAPLLTMLMAAQPTGEKAWISMLNGKDLAAWKARDEKAPPTWKFVDQVQLDPKNPKKLIASGEGGKSDSILLRIDVDHGTDLISDAIFGNCELHVEFMVPKDGNSGVFFMGQYEMQIIDSFGIPDAKLTEGDAGGIPWLKKPPANACKAPGEWQTLDAVFQAPRFDPVGKKTQNAKLILLTLNGKKMQENVEIPEPTGGELEGGERPKGPIVLQGDHGMVAIRNLRVLPR